MKNILRLTLNGRLREDLVPDNMLLLDYLREAVGLTGTKQGCDGGECGACTVLVDDRPRLACSTLAHQVAGRKVETVESLSTHGTLSRLQAAFHEKLGTQCGFCTPGMLLTAQDLLAKGGVPSRDDIREHLSGNYCRCTGYHAIVDAVEATARQRAAKE